MAVSTSYFHIFIAFHMIYPFELQAESFLHLQCGIVYKWYMRISAGQKSLDTELRLIFKNLFHELRHIRIRFHITDYLTNLWKGRDACGEYADSQTTQF